MLRQIVVAFILVSINVTIHATGMVELFHWLTRKQPKIEKKFDAVKNTFSLSKFSRLSCLFISHKYAYGPVITPFGRSWRILKPLYTSRLSLIRPLAMGTSCYRRVATPGCNRRSYRCTDLRLVDRCYICRCEQALGNSGRTEQMTNDLGVNKGGDREGIGVKLPSYTAGLAAHVPVRSSNNEGANRLVNIAGHSIRKSVIIWVVTIILLGAGFVSVAAAAETEEHGLPQKAVEIARPFGFPITNSMVVTWIVAAGLIIFTRVTTRDMKHVPGGAQNLLEWLVAGLYGFLESIIGRVWSSGRSGFWEHFHLHSFGQLGEPHSRVGTIGWGHQGPHGFVVDQPFFRGANADLNLTLAMALVFFVCWIIWALQEVVRLDS